MKTKDNTILINGGSAGMGLAMARLLATDNQVIITGRDPEKLNRAVSGLKNVTGILCDVTNQQDVDQLLTKIRLFFPGLNMIINNAGKGHIYDITLEGVGSFEKAADEMLTNYLSVIRLCELFLPILKTHPRSAIVNVSSIAVFGPRTPLATYGASKAALHAYTLALRLLLEDTVVQVFELMPPLVNTDFTKDFNGHTGMAPEAVAARLLEGLTNNEFEIHVGQTAELYDKYFPDAGNGFLALNGRL